MTSCLRDVLQAFPSLPPLISLPANIFLSYWISRTIRYSSGHKLLLCPRSPSNILGTEIYHYQFLIIIQSLTASCRASYFGALNLHFLIPFLRLYFSFPSHNHNVIFSMLSGYFLFNQTVNPSRCVCTYYFTNNH